MSQTLTPGENKITKIDEIADNMILALTNYKDTSSVSVSDILAYIDMSREEEEIALIVNRIKENRSKINDLDTGIRNISALDDSRFNKLYGRDLPSQKRGMIREGYEEENKTYYKLLEDRGINYNEEINRKDYLNFKVEKEDNNNKRMLVSAYSDLRKYTDAQITSDLTARTMYHMIMDSDKAITSMLDNDEINKAVTEVIKSMNLSDLEEVVNEEGKLKDIALNESLMNDENESFTALLDGKVFSEMLSEIALQNEVENEEDVISDKYVGSYNDDFGYEENLDDDENELV